VSHKKYDKELKETYDELRKINKESKKNRNDLLHFFIGLLMFGTGVFLILQNAQVSNLYGRLYHLYPSLSILAFYNFLCGFLSIFDRM